MIIIYNIQFIKHFPFLYIASLFYIMSNIDEDFIIPNYRNGGTTNIRFIRNQFPMDTICHGQYPPMGSTFADTSLYEAQMAIVHMAAGIPDIRMPRCLNGDTNPHDRSVRVFSLYALL